MIIRTILDDDLEEAELVGREVGTKGLSQLLSNCGLQS